MTTLNDAISALSAIILRNDMTTAQATSFIQMAQTRIERTLRVPGQENVGTITANSTDAMDAIVLPQDFLSLKYLYTPGESGMDLMEYKDLASFFKAQKRLAWTSIIPKYYTRVGSSYLITPPLPADPTGTAAIYMVYYAAQPMLVNPTDSNFFSISLQDLLVYGALSYAGDYFVDDRTASFEARFTQLLNDIAEQGRETDWSQSDMAVAPAHSDY
jgi:hypothetical protein